LLLFVNDGVFLNNGFNNMLYCRNPQCHNPFNFNQNKICEYCGSEQLSSLFRHRFRVLKQISEGNFTRTYQGKDLDRMGDDCIIKQFSPQIQGSAALKQARELFKQEAQRLYDLGDHPQIPRLIAYFEEDQRLYLVQELIIGKSLLQELEEEGIFPENKIRQILNDLLPLLKFIHENNIIHRNIKPENIVRRQKDGKLMLIDFGVSQEFSSQIFAKFAPIIGTTGYRPIEQMRGQTVGASDIYSLGISCIRLMTGCLPKNNGADDIYDVMNGELNWQKKNPRDLEISLELKMILGKMAANYIKDRYQSAEAVMSALNVKNAPIQNSVTNQITILPPPNIQQIAPPNFISNLGINYNKLRYLLAAQKWCQADQETFNTMLKILYQTQEMNQTDDSMFQLEMNIINQLWVKYSKGIFGFSVQKTIYEHLGGGAEFNEKIWDKFADIVGWKVKNQWLFYNNINFSLKAHPGHLPARIWDIGDGSGVGSDYYLMPKLLYCEFKQG
jgi:serine/threonine protein kinase